MRTQDRSGADRFGFWPFGINKMATKFPAFRPCIAAVLTGMLLSALPTTAFGQDDHRPATKPPSRTVTPATNPTPASQPMTMTAAPTAFGSPYGYGVIGLGNGIDLKLALIPGGKFWMGGGAWGDKLYHDKGRLTLYEAELSKPYYMGIYLLTEEQYVQVMGIEKFRKFIVGFRGRQKEPLASACCLVKFDLATEFCETLSRKTGNTVRLPTETEWERACRAGTKTWYFFGDDSQDLEKYAWVESDYQKSGMWVPIELARTLTIGKKRPNPWGLYDMYGNGQLCSDWARTGGELEGKLDRPGIDPKGPPTHHGLRGNFYHVVKGVFRVGDHFRDAAGSRGGTIQADESRNSSSMGVSLRVVVDYPIVPPKDYVGVVKFLDLKPGKYLDEKSYLVFATGVGNMTASDGSLSVNGMGVSVVVDNLNKTPSAPTKASVIKQGESLQLAILNTPDDYKGPPPDESKPFDRNQKLIDKYRTPGQPDKKLEQKESPEPTLPAPDKDIYAAFKDAKAGDLFKVKFEVLNGQKIGQIVSVEPYKMSPGEDQPGVYVFQRTSRVGIVLEGAERPVVVVSKFLEETTLAVMDVDILAALDKFKTGDSVKVTVAGKVLKAIEAYKP